jgi:4-aminobutyrate aminotransferase-like enzyme
MLNTHTRYLHDSIIEYGERLVSTFDQELDTLHLCCSGTEANELALRIAKACSGGTGVIVTDFCYHGNSSSIAELSTAFPGPEGLGPHVRTIKVPDYPLNPKDFDRVSTEFAGQVADAIDSLDKEKIKPAALLIDTVFATDGMPRLPAKMISDAVRIIRNAGGYYIADEVQPGFGRTGLGMWGYSIYDTVPDLVTLGKPMGNGYPLAGVVSKSELSNIFSKSTSYFNTFAGNPVASRVGLAVLDILENEKLIENARDVGNYLEKRLLALSQRYTIIDNVRGYGFFVGAEFLDNKHKATPATIEVEKIVNEMRERGVLISQTGRHNNILKIRPPMPFSRDNADLLIDTLADCLAKLDYNT